MLAAARVGLVVLALSDTVRQAMAHAFVLRMRITLLSNPTTPGANGPRARGRFTRIKPLR